MSKPIVSLTVDLLNTSGTALVLSFIDDRSPVAGPPKADQRKAPELCGKSAIVVLAV
jgi:hypothetical protein